MKRQRFRKLLLESFEDRALLAGDANQAQLDFAAEGESQVAMVLSHHLLGEQSLQFAADTSDRAQVQTDLNFVEFGKLSDASVVSEEPLAVVLVNDRLPHAERIAEAAADQAIVELYDGESTTADELFARLLDLSRQHGDAQLSGVAIVTHGAPGVLQVSTAAQLHGSDLATLESRFAEVRSVLTPDAHFEFYACSLAGETELVSSLAAALGATVLASTNEVGSGELGDLSLEFSSSTAQTSGSLLAPELLEQIEGFHLPSALAAPTLVAPTSGATGVSTTPTFSWNAVNGANTYRILVATSQAALPSGSDNPGSGLLINTTTSGTSFTPSAGALPAGTTLHWEVRAGNTSTGAGGYWSSKRSFTTVAAALPAPTLTSPANGATSVSTTPTFNWNGVSGANTYRILVSTSLSALPTGANNPVNSSSLLVNATTSGTSYTPSLGVLPAGATLHWEVRAGNTTSGAGGYWSSARSFTTAASFLSGPRIISHTPLGTVTAPINSVDVTFDKSIQASTFSTLDVMQFTSSNGSIAVTSVVPVSGNTYRIGFGSQTAAGTYTMVIGSNISDPSGNLMNQDGDTNNGEATQDQYTLTFTLQPPTALSAPTLMSPANGATGASTTPTFGWNAVAGADTYRILVATTQSALPSGTSNPGSGLLINTTTSSTSFVPTAGALPAGNTLHWVVRAGNSTTGAGGTWSSPASFVTAPPAGTGDQYESDNTASQAQLITSGVTQAHSIHTLGDTDWVKFTLTAPSEVSIVTTSDSPAVKELTLYGPDNVNTLRNYANDTYGTGQSARLFFNGSDALGAGTYYVRINAQNNNAVISNYTVALNVTPAVGLSLRGGGVGPIDPAKTTWVVVHGRSDRPDSARIGGLAAAIDGFSTSDQVLVVDWHLLSADNSSAPGAVITGAEDWIKPVASWVSTRLAELGFVGDYRNNVNLVGHSWGSYVSAEIAERLMLVNTIVALDPAQNGAGSFNPDEGDINFGANSNYAWAFFESGNDIYGSSVTPLTADESIVVLNSSHSAVVDMFTNLVTSNTGNQNTAVSQYFTLNRLLLRSAGPWAPNRFSSNGTAGFTGSPYEAVIRTDNNGTRASMLDFSTKQPLNLQASENLVDRVRLTWSPVEGAESYEVWRNSSNNLSTATRIAAGNIAPSFDDTSAVPGASYFYWVAGVHSSTTGLFSVSDIGSRSHTSIASVSNGGFETGNLSGWYVVTGGEFPKLVSSGMASGSYALQLGDGGAGLGGGNTASIQQTIAIPASASMPTLSLKHKVGGSDGAGQWDWMKLFINGTEVQKWFADTAGWKTFSYDLSAYKGTSVTITFSSWTADVSYPVNYFLDDIAVGSAPAANASLVNGGFESGNVSGWTSVQGGEFPKVVTSGAASGSYALQLGDGGSGLGGGNTASIQQTVSIPASSVKPTLSLKYKVVGNDGEQWDWMKIFINGVEIAKWYSDTGGWKSFTYDLSVYKGQSVTIQFSCWTADAVGPVNYFIDDISIV